MTDYSRQNRASGDWSVAHRILFRFASLYWVFYFLPQFGAVSLIDILPWNTESISHAFAWPLQRISLWAGAHVFHLTGAAATLHPPRQWRYGARVCPHFQNCGRPDLGGLARLFFFRQQAQLRTDHVPASERRWLRRVGYALQALVLLFALYT